MTHEREKIFLNDNNIIISDASLKYITIWIILSDDIVRCTSQYTKTKNN